jgi:hypothetical protein
LFATGVIQDNRGGGIIDHPEERLHRATTRGCITGEDGDMRHPIRHQGKTSDECRARPSSRGLLPCPLHIVGEGSLRSYDDHGISEPSHARHRRIQERPALRVAEREFVGTETAGFTPGDDNRG